MRSHLRLRFGLALFALLSLVALACSDQLLGPGPLPDGGQTQAGAQVTRSALVSGAQTLTTQLGEGWESGLNGWTAATTSGVATWHVLTHPESLAISPALNPVAVTLADDGSHLPAAQGTNVVWFGNDDTGTYIGSDYLQPVTSKGGGSSKETQSGTLTSPAISLAGFTKAQIEFDSWWEVEGVASTSYDLMKVEVSSDNGATFTQVGQLNPTFATAEPDYAAYSSGGPSEAPVWRHYAYDISSFAGSTILVRFEFNSRDSSYNAFRGWTLDNVAIGGGSTLPAPTLTSVSPATATLNDVVTINGTDFAQGATFQIGTMTIAASAIVQFGTDSLIFKVPSGLAAGTYDVTVKNPDGQSATLPGALTYSASASPTVNSPTASPPGAVPSSVGLFTPQNNVTINGTGFLAGATVLVGSTPATNVVVVSANQITATFPALAAGTYNVTVTNPSGQSGTGYAEYTAADTSVITVTAPASGTIWAAGTTQNITWTVTGTSVVGIDLYKGGTFVTTIVASVDATSGSYAWTLPGNLPVGTDYTIKVYNPNGTSGAFSEGTFSVTSISTTTTLTSSLNPASPADSVTFTAHLSPASATGSVQFADNGTPFGAAVPVSGGTATSSAIQLTYGSHTITALFTGTGGYAGSSASLTESSNTTPVATAQSVTTAEDTAKAITLAGSDADGDGLTYAVVGQPTHGTLTGTAPNLTYAPSANDNGTDSFTFMVTDINGATSSLATVSITITAVNDAPVANGQSATTSEDTSKSLTLAATDVDGDALTYAVVTPPAHGTLTGTAPNLTYVPAANYHGADSFTFKANDGTVDSTVATVSLTVASVNDAPVAAPQSITTAEDTSATVTLGATDVDGDALTYAVVTPPAHGTLTGAAPNLTYVPAANYHGADSFTFKANDGIVDSTVATIGITVTSENDAPVANGQAVSTDEDTSASIVLAATDVDGDALTYAVVTPPAHGTLSGSAPNLTYVPATNYHGADSFTFKANDGTVDSSVATVNLTVASVNDAPVAAPQSITTAEDTAAPVTLAATDVDGDALTYVVVTPPAHGSLSGTGSSLTYVPNANYDGPDSFTFKANDGTIDSNVATVSVTITPVNDAPVASAQSVTTDEDTTAPITLAATDVDGDPVTYAVVTPPAHGTLLGTAPNLIYVPAANYNGPDSFTFQASDGSASSPVATVSITVTSVNDAPVAAPQQITTAEETSTPVTLSASDVDRDALTYAIVTLPSHGTISGTAPNLTYVPNTNYNGPDSFSFKVNDGTVDSNIATVSLTITAVNDAPVAPGQSITTDEDTSASITLGATDVDGDALTYAIVTPPAHGTLTGVAPNLTYVPAANFHGTDAFTFKANDGAADSNVATVSLTVASVNDAPVSSGQSVTTDEDTSAPITLGATDVDGDALTYAILTPPAHGTLTGTAPNLTYVPAPNYNGADSFTFQTSDGVTTSNVATVSLTVSAVDDAPVAAAQSVDTDEDTSVAVTLAATDVEGDALTYSVVTPPAHGTLTGIPPNLTYMPNANANGPDSFTFQASDGVASSNVATVSLNVAAVDDAPVATAQSLSTDEDTSVAVTLAGTDVESDALTFAVVTPPVHGTLTGTAPNLTYVPDANYNGSDSFTFKANDGVLDSAPAMVSLTVASVNDAPVAQPQSLTTAEDTNLPVTLAATDTDGDALTYSVVTSPAHGTLTGAPPNLTYVPNADFNGSDSFTFKANDGSADSQVVSIDLTVTAVNDAPVAAAQSLSTAEDTGLTIGLAASDVDGDPLTYRVISPPAHGTLTGSAPNLTYVPSANYDGPDSFTFVANDGTVDSAIATVGLTVTAVNDAPVAATGSVTTDEDTPAQVVLSASDIDADALSYRIVTPPAHGTLSGSAPNLVYTPEANYHGPDGFTFSVNDSTVDSNVATVSLTVTSVNDAPVADTQSLTMAEDGSVDVVLSGSDVDGDSLGFTITVPPTHGTLSGTAPNLVYTPEPNFNGTDSFAFVASDGVLSSAATTVTLSVASVNDAPVAQDQALTTAEDNALPITLGASDVDGDTLRFTVVTPPAHGTLSGNGAQVVYTPAANYDGPDAFTFEVNDGSADSNVATVALQVTAVDDVPVADGQSVALKADIATPVMLTGSDIEGAALTYRVVGRPAHGVLSGTAPNLVYTPANDFHGTDQFTFSVTASGVESAPATVSITVEGTRDTLSGGAVGCSAGGSRGDGAYLFVAFAALLLFRRRSERSTQRPGPASSTVAAIGAAAVLVVPVVAHAQSRLPTFDPETFHPSLGAEGSLSTDSGLLLAPGELRLSLTFGEEHDPLVFVRDGERLGSIVNDRITSYLGAAWSPTAWLEVGAQLPVVLAQGSDDLSHYGFAEPTSMTVGTSLLQAQVALLQQQDGRPIDLAVSFDLSIPIGSATGVARERGVGAAPRVALGRRVLPWLRVGGELGMELRPSTTFGGETLGRTAVETALVAHTLGQKLRGELSWRLAVPTDGETSGSELLGGIRVPAMSRVEVFALGGVGLTRGIGTPAYRVLLGGAWTFDVGGNAARE